MIKKLYSIYDKKSKNFGTIFEEFNDLVALRNFEQVVNDKNENNIIRKYPEDFELHSLGERDTETGIITAKTIKVADARTYYKEETQN